MAEETSASRVDFDTRIAAIRDHIVAGPALPDGFHEASEIVERILIDAGFRHEHVVDLRLRKHIFDFLEGIEAFSPTSWPGTVGEYYYGFFDVVPDDSDIRDRLRTSVFTDDEIESLRMFKVAMLREMRTAPDKMEYEAFLLSDHHQALVVAAALTLDVLNRRGRLLDRV
jgi:hypothetical protein